MRIVITMGVLLVGTGLVLSACVAQQSKAPTTMAEVTQASSIFMGGQMYDKWWAVTGADEPTTTHPSYPAAGKKKGKDTWRCKECHGWDFMGKDGAYASGSHFSGVKGIKGVEHASVDSIVSILRGDVHGFTKAMISDAAINELALFVSLGQVDFDSFIDRGTKKVKGGDLHHGHLVFDSVCARCHGADGREINFKSDPKKEFVGTVAAGNPWETYNKIHNGQPESQMPALGWLSSQDQIDILAYAQTLPTK